MKTRPQTPHHFPCVSTLTVARGLAGAAAAVAGRACVGFTPGRLAVVKPCLCVAGIAGAGRLGRAGAAAAAACSSCLTGVAVAAVALTAGWGCFG